MAQSTETDTSRVLFVGNSYTYFWNLPQAVELMAESRGIPLYTRQSTAGGSNWGQHWTGKKGLQTVPLIQQTGWTHVVIQNHSRSTIDSIDAFMEYGIKLCSLIRAEGAEPMLYQTWARRFNPLMQDTISAAYARIGQKTNSDVVPVGQAWKMARQLRPDLDLYDQDQSHPSPAGTYLAACVFFSALTGEPAEGLPHRLITKDADGEKLYIAIMGTEDARFLQQVADRTLATTQKMPVK